MESMGELFSYNREGFVFDKEQNQQREYQGQNMRIAQFEMYRQDIDDLVNLTVSKMDSYLLVNTLMFGFCIVLLTEGRPRETPPEWLLWLYGMTTMGALLFLVMSMWLALHASVAAHSFGARVLTQFVRLPVPDTQQIDAARAFATEYETGKVTDMMRLPMLERLNNAMEEFVDAQGVGEPDEDTVVPGQPESAGMLKHFRLFRQLQANWQAYDAYTRVCMSAGVNQLLHAFIYSSLVILATEAKSPMPALCFAVVLAACSWLVTRLDLFLSRKMLTLVGTFVTLPPVMAWAGIIIEYWNYSHPLFQHRDAFINVIVPVIYAFHIGWIVLIISFAKAHTIGEVALPIKFRSVLYLDVFGWLTLPSSPSRRVSAAPSRQVSDRSHASADDGELSRSATGRHTRNAMPEEEDVVEREPVTLLGELERQVRRERTRSTSEGPPGSARPRAFTSASVVSRRSARPPTIMRSSLEESCERQLAELRSHLERWEAEAVQDLLRGSTWSYYLDGVRATRERLDRCVEQLAEVAPELAGAADRDEGPMAGTLWLTLEWNPSGTPTRYYVHSGTGDCVWSRPCEAQDRVVELGDLLQQLAELQERVQAVVEMRRAEMAAAAEAAAGAEEEEGTVRAAGQDAAPRGGEPRERAVAPRISLLPRGPSMRSQSVTSQESAFREDIGEALRDEGQAQETRSSERESVQLMENPVRHCQAASARSADHYQTYHTPMQRKPPGKIPWRVFSSGACVLLVVWCTKCVWVIVSIATGIDIHIKPPQAESPIPGPERVFAGNQWPDELFRPFFLACHTSLDPQLLLVGDRFSIHELRLRDVTGTDELLPVVRPVLRDCMSDAPEFHAGGVAGLALDCAPVATQGGPVPPAAAATPAAWGCTAVLLGADPRQGLRCPLGESPGGANGSTPRRPAPLTLHGGRYHALASAAGGSGAFWAREAGGASVRLRPLRGAAGGGLVPHLEVGGPQAAEAPQLQLVLEEEDVVLTLEPGRLVARRLGGGGGGRAVLWSAPLPRGVAWRGGCAAGGAAYLLGGEASPSGGAAAGVWRVRFPHRGPSDDAAPRGVSAEAGSASP